ncbi:hypothetical protein SAMN05216359_1055 [Roseateles sp. YR242]|uniref:hypothetical protein n=1 Tax=Roseateles sp. YR242 TaxID=1855305 RepID=UPI0008CC0C5C|nr:hypothetical protein [Roseateles sp. YR242]SEL06241.1 hypothetical protein SAMN05216359_1055 [Roseateles sp. YR242]
MFNAHSPDRDPLPLSAGGVAQPPSGVATGAVPGSLTDSLPLSTLRAAGGALDGRRIGLICQSRQGPAAALFIEAAEGLGAQVSVVHAGDLLDAGTGQQDKLVQMLARLYDALECQDLPPGVVRRISELVAVPVLCNLGASALRDGDGSGAEAQGAEAQGGEVRGGELPSGEVRRTEAPAWQQGLLRVQQALLRAL